MEVCGRLHHAMPALVQVVTPTVFALWCMTQSHVFEPHSLAGSFAAVAASATAGAHLAAAAL